MILVDESIPVGENEPSFAPRDVTLKRGVNVKEQYNLLSEIGRGKFGTVYKCEEKATGLQLAAKFIPIPKRDDRRNVEREVDIMNTLQHPLIIQLYDAFEYQKMMCVVLELIEGGELFDRVIDDEFVLSERACTVLIRQLCQAMEFVHRNNIIHLDLKPENILCLSREGNRIKVIDFGLARRFDPDKKLQVLFGTPEFVAPEVVNFDRISFGTDMWSVGVICYVLLSGLSPFMGTTDVETMANVTIGKYDFDDEAFTKVSKESLDFISKLLEKDINIRMNAEQCLEHVWLKQMAETEHKAEPLPTINEMDQSPSPIIELIENVGEKDVELSTSKENLKAFIERWEEHPNSPYVFDGSATLILPINQPEKNSSSGFSSRGCSPSPCASLSSVSTSNTNGDNKINDSNNEALFESSPSRDTIAQNKEYLQSFDRRHSDSNSSPLEKVNLADEIRKLSERLLMLSSINTELQQFNQHSNSTTCDKENLSTENGQSISIDATYANDNDNNNNNEDTIIRTNGTENISNQSSIDDDSSDGVDADTDTEKDDLVKHVDIAVEAVADTTEKDLSLSQQIQNVPWTVTNRRTKFRMTQLSRDVSHDNIFLEEAATTTKCLLHLLDKYNGGGDSGVDNDIDHHIDSHISIRSNGGGINGVRRHQSISVGGDISNNLEYQSMSSINAFFKRSVFQKNGTIVKQMQTRLQATKK